MNQLPIIKGSKAVGSVASARSVAVPAIVVQFLKQVIRAQASAILPKAA